MQLKLVIVSVTCVNIMYVGVRYVTFVNVGYTEVVLRANVASRAKHTRPAPENRRSFE